MEERGNSSGDDMPGNRKRKRVVLSSSTESEEEEGIILTRYRPRQRTISFDIGLNSSDDSSNESFHPVATDGIRRVFRFSSSEDSGDSSDDSIQSFRVGRSRPVVESEGSSEEDQPINPRALSLEQSRPKNRPKLVVTSSELSDSGDETTEKCAICLRSIKTQEIGSPEGCDHIFCLMCIVEWAKNSNECPLDRQKFELILVRESKFGQVVRQLPVSEPSPHVQSHVDHIFCCFCGQSDRDDELLLCDGCDRGFHLNCLNPPLPAVPDVDEWFCPFCIEIQQEQTPHNSSMQRNSEDEEEMLPHVREGTSSVSRSPRAGQRTRRTTGVRTRRSTRIWISVQEALLRFFEADLTENEPAASELTLETTNEPARAGSSGTNRVTSTTTTRRRRTTAPRAKPRKVKRKKRKVTRKRYIVRKKKVLMQNEDGTVTEETVEVRKQIRRRRRKKKIVRRKTRSGGGRSRPTATSCLPASPSTVRGRLARALGMAGRPTTGLLLPQVATRRRLPVSTRTGNSSHQPSAIPTLHIFAPRDELAPVSSGSDIEGGDEGGVATMAQLRPSFSSRARDRSKAAELLRAPRPTRIPEPPVLGPVDLLSSILESQAIWHSRNTDVTIQNDGTVIPRPARNVNVNTGTLERSRTQAPMHPAASSQPSSTTHSLTPANSASSSSSEQTNSAAGYGPGRLSGSGNGRDGYVNYLNNVSGGGGGGPPERRAPFCRGGAPLRFRMPPRQTLRRIPLLPRHNRPAWQQDDEEEENNDGETENAEVLSASVEAETKRNDEEVDLYSDIETNNTEKDGEGSEGSGAESSFPTLGPPPEPPAFLLSLAEETDKNNDSEQYDPAEPCDSDEEMVIDEGGEEPRRLPAPAPIPRTPSPLDTHANDPADEECPIFSLYSTESVEHSRKGEEERARELQLSIHDDSGDRSLRKSPSPEKPAREAVGTRLSFDIGQPQESSQDSSGASHHSKSPEYEDEEKENKDGDHSDSSSRADSIIQQYPIIPSSPSDVPCTGAENLNSDDIHDKNEDGSCPRVTTGLEGLDVEEVSSENDFIDKGSMCSFSMSGMSDGSRGSSPVKIKIKKKKKRQKVKDKLASEEGEIDSDKEKQKELNNENKSFDENKSENEKSKKKRKASKSPERQVLGSKENRRKGDKDVSWKKPSKKDKNYREGRKLSKERGKSKEKRTSRSPSPKKDKKKGKDKRKLDKDKKKEIERYDVRKVVKNKEVEVRKTDEFGRDIPTKSLSRSRSRSHSKSPVRSRVARRRVSRSPSPSPVRGFRRGRSPVRRRFRSRSRSSPSPRRTKKKARSIERKGRSRSRTRKSRSRSPRRPVRGKKGRAWKSWSRSRSLSLSPPRSPTPPAPARIRRSFSRSWSRLRSPPVREPSLEKLTVVLTSKDKKKRKKKKDERRFRKVDLKKKKSGNSKEVFASGDNVLVSVNFNRSKSGNTPRFVSTSPIREVRKKKRAVEEADRPAKKNKPSSTVSKTIVDAALQGLAPKRKKLTRLNEKDAEIILNRKPVAVIDLDMSPYREQTPSPVNVVVVSDSGSGDEGKAPSPSRPRTIMDSGVAVPTLTTPLENASGSGAYISSSGPKTPPEPSVKFSILKPQQIMRPIVNPLADGEDPEEDEDDPGRQEKEGEQLKENQHKGPNTPPEPRPTTPKTTPSPQSSPDAYDPFEPTKSRSPSPAQPEQNHDITEAPTEADAGVPLLLVTSDDNLNTQEPADTNENLEESDVKDETEPQAPIADGTKHVPMLSVKPAALLMKKIVTQPAIPNAASALPQFSLPSPNKASNRQQAGVISLQMSGIQRLQHRLGSPVNKTPNSIKNTPEKRGPELLSTGNFKVRNAGKRNGDGKPRPLQDATNETVDMDDSPYSPASSEGDDLFDPPAEIPKPVKSAPVIPYKPANKTTPTKVANKFDLLFGSGSAPTVSPMKNGGKKSGKVGKGALPKLAGNKPKKSSKKGISLKMDEDQLRILDELPSSAVELQVKDKFLKKLNRQERVVDEVKTVLKPHYARKHVTKEEYKEILRRAVPKICHSKSGEINPSKIQHLVEAYVRKYRHAKKKGSGTGGVASKPKMKKTTMFS